MLPARHPHIVVSPGTRHVHEPSDGIQTSPLRPCPPLAGPFVSGEIGTAIVSGNRRPDSRPPQSATITRPEGHPHYPAERGNWWTLPESNRPPSACKANTLPTELKARVWRRLTPSDKGSAFNLVIAPRRSAQQADEIRPATAPARHGEDISRLREFGAGCGSLSAALVLRTLNPPGQLGRLLHKTDMPSPHFYHEISNPISTNCNSS